MTIRSISESRTNRNPASNGVRILQNWLERMIFGSGLVFNQVWEDPAVDRQALAITADDVVLTIASAGDNVLGLALDNPKKIYTVDLNPAQIFLLRLKIAAVQQLNYTDFWHLFSLDPAPRAPVIYHKLRSHLDSDTQRFWDSQLGLFRSGLYRAGVFGRMLWVLRTYLEIICGRYSLEQLFEAPSISEQAEFYRKRIHDRWWNRFARPFADQLPVLLLFGAHPHQAWRVRDQRFANFLASGIGRALTTLPIRDNFFWQQVFLGRYLTPPDYARPENFSRLKSVARAIETHVGRLEDLLGELPPGSVTCFNLLDAPDWLSSEETVKLWTLIRRAAAPAARVLFRTIDPSYCLPTCILANWRDETNPVWTLEERTGVYAQVYLYVLS
jgi:S-adenosylmethionine-diacylglycerol 3-amino-3-carboxypropyl transferase